MVKRGVFHWEWRRWQPWRGHRTQVEEWDWIILIQENGLICNLDLLLFKALTLLYMCQHLLRKQWKNGLIISKCVFFFLLPRHTPQRRLSTPRLSRTKREWLHCFAGVCLVFLGQQGDYYCSESPRCCWWCQIIMHKQTELRDKVCCRGSPAISNGREGNKWEQIMLFTHNWNHELCGKKNNVMLLSWAVDMQSVLSW